MTIEDFKSYVKNKNVGVLGIGVSNTPLICMLSQMGAKVTARDKKNFDDLGDTGAKLKSLGVRLVLGENYLEGINEDIIFKTPGMRIDIPQLVQAKNRGSIITSEMEVFFDVCPAEIIAVTGSDGKTTTTTLIYEMLKAEGFTCHLGGNIGKPLLSEIYNIKPEHKVVVELSSFQLHTMKKSPSVAVVTNLSPNHLDMHKSMEEYIAAKENIYKYQNLGDVLVLNFDNEITKSFACKAKGKVISFGTDKTNDVYVDNDSIYFKSTHVLNCRDIFLPGKHNVENYMAAIAAVYGQVSDKTIKKVAKTFGGVEHRIEFVREAGGVRYYNDSIASSPTRATAGLYSFDQKVVLIAGGYDKEIPFEDFGKVIAKRVKTLILLGATAEKIKTAVENAQGEKPEIIMSESLEQAVKTASSVAQKGDVVLLSPACASFDMFKNFEERGKMFKKLVMEL
ncbi:MAG: UDP-N-acetylmuramoyl-L-alanine--D-glutamate ligase [Eubacteriales bacterium]|jgi:UDP-N-acetylmuramoylalanine--D-glutamate ligase|nr:UDP-N-acetylmuramoyl-L-alanine--D-glutamate ligase [Eubacteriales bacterium]